MMVGIDSVMSRLKLVGDFEGREIESFGFLAARLQLAVTGPGLVHGTVKGDDHPCGSFDLGTLRAIVQMEEV
jgi:hypothetical protein